MKRRNCFLIILCLILFLLISHPALSHIPLGDIAPVGTPDGQVNVGDALIALRFALNLEPDHPTADELSYGDVAPIDANNMPNPDGQITVGDALIILRVALGLMGQGKSQAPTIYSLSIAPSTVIESEIINNYAGFKLEVSAEASDPQWDSITYSYQWYVNNTSILGETESILPASAMTRQGHTCRGYEYKCEVVAIDSKGHDSTPRSISVTVEGTDKLTYAIKGALFSNMDRDKSQPSLANPSLITLVDHISCNWVSLGIIYYQSNKEATEIYEKTFGYMPNTVVEADLIAQIEHAHRLGLKVMLYPEIWIDDPTGAMPGERNEISGSDEWFSAYQGKILHLADIAETYHVEILCIGVELQGTQDKDNKWRSLISAVRNRYVGELTYACIYGNILYDENPVAFWDALDYIGVSCSFETWAYDNYDPTVEFLRSTYEAFVDDFKSKAYDVYHKPLLITELNIFSRDGASIDFRHGKKDVSDFQEQSDFFEAAFEALNDKEWISGIFVIGWFSGRETWYLTLPDLSWPFDSGFDNKPAEKVIKSWFADS